MPLVFVAGFAAPAWSQERFEPYLGITLHAGTTAGATLWSVPAQPMFVPNSGDTNNPSLFDTVAVGRTLRRGIALGFGMTWHRTPRFAFGGTVEYVGRPSTQHCAPVAPWNAEPTDQLHPVDEHFNQQLCGSADGSTSTSGVLTVVISAQYRLATGAIAPYVGLGLGVGGPVGSFVETLGTVTSNSCPNLAPSCQVLLYDREIPKLRPVAAPSLGLAFKVAPLTTLLVEARDVMGYLPVAETTPVTQAHTRTRSALAHSVVFHAGLEMAFVARHDRRY